MDRDLYIRILDNRFDMDLRLEELRSSKDKFDDLTYCWLLSRLNKAKEMLTEAICIMEGFYPDDEDKSPFEEGETDEQQEDTITDEA